MNATGKHTASFRVHPCKTHGGGGARANTQPHMRKTQKNTTGRKLSRPAPRSRAPGRARTAHLSVSTSANWPFSESLVEGSLPCSAVFTNLVGGGKAWVRGWAATLPWQCNIPKQRRRCRGQDVITINDWQPTIAKQTGLASAQVKLPGPPVGRIRAAALPSRVKYTRGFRV